MTEQATTVYEASVSGHTAKLMELRTYHGRPEALLRLPSLGVQGVVFREGPTGRRAIVAGTGLDVWEIIATWRAVNGDYERLKASYSWLTEAQLQAALEYYKRNKREIEARLAREEKWTPEATWSQFPFTRPQS